jgi:FAD/FMN-containing dehydrogenase
MVAGPATVTARELDRLRRAFRGDIISPADPTYDEARRLWNAMLDRRPAAILRPMNAAEVAIAVAFAREHDLVIAVRSGGHSVAGVVGPDGGLVIDLSAMQGVAVDPGTRLARVDGGTLLGALDVAAQAHGLVCPVGVVGHTGVAGLTLGGGVGRLQRRFGLTIDNLGAVELVTADGRLVRASETEEPELFWGLRGAGWNFGIATAFEFRLQPFGPGLHRGIRIYPATQAQEVWAVFREYTESAPETVSVIFGIDRAGPTVEVPEALAGRPIVYVAYNHSGSADDVERDTAGLRTGPVPVSDTTGSQPYLEVQGAHDLVLGWGRRSYLLGTNGTGLRAEAIDALVELVATAPGEGTFSVTALGGSIARVPEDAMAYAGRAAAFDLSADIAWTDAALDEACRAWTHQAMTVVARDAALGRYANGISAADPEQTRSIYGDAKLTRLADLKRTWDPGNVFRLNHNVAPAGHPAT